MKIPRESIDADADKVVRRLARSNHKAYLVGGCVRDLLLDRQPKDFDVATSATPREIKQLFRNCRIIGRRFRLAHIFFGDKIIETSTFRANPRQGENGSEEELLIRRDNTFGTDTEDARRRDFTINGLFYDVELEKVIDHVGGLADLEARVVRTIGEPHIRFREDPVRMMRAIKFAARLGFDIEPETYAALVDYRGEITKCAPPRVLEEVYRLLRGGAARRSMELFVQSGVATALAPALPALLGPVPSRAAEATTVPAEPETEPASTGAEPVVEAIAGEPAEADETPTLAAMRQHAWELLDQLDAYRVTGADKPSNALLLALLIAPFTLDDILAPGVRPLQATELVMDVLGPLASQLRIARRDTERARQVLLAQRRMAPSRRRRGRPMAMLRRDYFREAVTLYELLALAAGRPVEEVEHWRRLMRQGQDNGDDGGAPTRKRRRRRRGGRRRRTRPASAAPGVALADDDDDGRDDRAVDDAPDSGGAGDGGDGGDAGPDAGSPAKTPNEAAGEATA